jgi:hypothetical protein
VGIVKRFIIVRRKVKMKKNNLKPVIAAVGLAVVFMAAPLGAVAAEARDMQGNKVMFNDEADFNYGGDVMAKYAGGKLATGKKDPAVCGTFAGKMCSMPHLQGK